MKKTVNILAWVVLIMLVGCISLYPTKNQFTEYEINDTTLNEILFTNNDFFQLSILEISSLIEDSTLGPIMASDMPYRKFEQKITAQQQNDHSSEVEELTVEETYLYLENISTSKVSNGTAVCFISYPLIDKKRQELYYKNPTHIHTKIIRDVLIGYWTRKDTNLTIILVRSNDYPFVMKGIYRDTCIGIKQVSHPCVLEVKKNKKIRYFSQTDDNIVYINLDQVLGLSGSSELLFFNIPKEKIFKQCIEIDTSSSNMSKLLRAFNVFSKSRIERETKEGEIKSLSIDTVNSRFFISALFNNNAEKPDTITYEFKAKNVHMVLPPNSNHLSHEKK